MNEYKSELFWLIISGILSNFILYKIQPFFTPFLTGLGLPKDYDFLPLPVSIVQLAFWILVFLLLRTTPSIITTWFSSVVKNKYNFDSALKKKQMTEERFSKEWILQGSVIPLNGGIFVSNSNSGCFIKNRLFTRAWKNFSATVEVDFSDQQDPRFEKRIGIIFRAQNFEDYLMLEFYKDKDDLLKFRPHVRLKGNWDAPYLDIDENMQKVTNDQITLDIEAEDNVVSVIVNGNKKKQFKWIIPTHIEVNLVQKTPDDSLSKTSVPELYFREKAGMFGFRCYGNQFAFIRSLDIS